jgi:hypothetical protein
MKLSALFKRFDGHGHPDKDSQYGLFPVGDCGDEAFNEPDEPAQARRGERKTFFSFNLISPVQFSS